MKKTFKTLLLVTLLILPSCSKNDVKVSEENISSTDFVNNKNEDANVYKSKFGNTYFYTDGFNHEMEYENKSVKVNGVLFTEMKIGAYYDTTAYVSIDLSNLNADEMQWILDDFDDLVGRVTANVYVNVDNEDVLMKFNKKSLTKTVVDSTPVLQLDFSLNKQKHSLDGNKAKLIIKIETKDQYSYINNEGKTRTGNKSNEYIFDFDVKIFK